MSGLACNFHKQAIREIGSRIAMEVLQRRRYGLRVLKAQLAMVEKHADCGRDLPGGSPIDGVQHPDGLDQDQM